MEDAYVMLQYMAESGCCPDKYTFSSFVNGFCRLGKVFEAIDFVDNDVIKSGCVPDIIMWTPILESLCREGRVDNALRLLDKISEQGLKPCRSTFNAVVKGLSVIQRVDDIRKFLHEMNRKSILPDHATYGALIDGKLHHLKGTVDLFKPLIGSHVVLNSNRYTSLIDGFFKSREVEFAKMVFNEMKRVRCAPVTSTYNAIIDGLCKSQNLDEAKEFFQSMKANGCLPDTITYSVLMCGLCNSGDSNEAHALYKEMQEDGCRPDLVTFGILLDGLARDGRMKMVISTLDDMKVQGCVPNETILKVLFRSLGPNDSKRVNKHIKGLFGIVYAPERNEILVKFENQEARDSFPNRNACSKGENAELVSPGRGRSKIQTLKKAVHKISQVLKEINRKQ
jgi:pentatricopeptide repeat protein